MKPLATKTAERVTLLEDHFEAHSRRIEEHMRRRDASVRRYIMAFIPVIGGIYTLLAVMMSILAHAK